MWITPAYAQDAVQEVNPFIMMAPYIFIALIFYFLLIRPQMTARKKHMEMVSNVRRGDTVVTQGGIIAKVTKVLDDNEVMVEIAENTVVKVLKSTLTDVRNKTQPANDQ